MKKNYKTLVQEFELDNDINLDSFIDEFHMILERAQEIKSLGVDAIRDTVVSFHFHDDVDGLLVRLEYNIPMTKEELEEIQENKKQMRQTKAQKMKEYMKLKKELGL